MANDPNAIWWDLMDGLGVKDFVPTGPWCDAPPLVGTFCWFARDSAGLR